MVKTTDRRTEPRHPRRFEKTTNMRGLPRVNAIPPGEG